VCGFCNMWLCVCVGFVMRGFEFVWVLCFAFEYVWIL